MKDDSHMQRYYISAVNGSPRVCERGKGPMQEIEIVHLLLDLEGADTLLCNIRDEMEHVTDGDGGDPGDRYWISKIRGGPDAVAPVPAEQVSTSRVVSGEAARPAPPAVAPLEKVARLRVEFDSVGPAVTHNLECWGCQKNAAVYDVNARRFDLCWTCQYKGER